MRLYRLLLILVLGIVSLTFLAPLSAEGNSAPAEQGCTALQPRGWVTYIVQSGDTLSDIATSTGSTVDELVRANCIGDSQNIVVDQRLFVPRISDHFVRRCLNAGFTEQECRRIYNALHDSDDHNFAERCLNAGFTAQQCRRIYNALFGDDDGLVERCRSAGLTPEQCRRLVNASEDRDIAARCRAAGLTEEECRRIVNASTDTSTELVQRDQERPADQPPSDGRDTRR